MDLSNQATIIISNTSPKEILLLHTHIMCTQTISCDQYEVLLPLFEPISAEEEKILQQFEKQFSHFFLLQEMTNRSIGLNRAAKQAKGNWLIFVESHCIMTQDWLETYLNFLQTTSCPCFRGEYENINSNNPVSQSAISIKTANKANIASHFLDFHHTAILKECFFNQGCLSEDIPILAEFEFGARLHQRGIPIGVFSQSLVLHKDDTLLSLWFRGVLQNGEDRMRLLLRKGESFSKLYFYSPFIHLWRVLRPVRWVFVCAAHFLIQIGKIGFFLSHALKKQNWMISFFTLSSINCNRLGYLQEMKQAKSIWKRAIHYVRTVLRISPPLPSQIDLEVSTSCNLNCKMCKRETIDFGNKLISLSIFTKIIDRLPKEVEMVSFGGYGEMLIHPKFFQMVQQVKQKGFRTQTTSNGTLLVNDRRIFKLLQCGLDEFRISIEHIHPPSDESEVGHVFSEKVLNILRRLVECHQQCKSEMLLGLNTVVHLGNIDEILGIIHLGEELGLHFIDLIHLNTCDNNASRTLSFQREKALYREIAKKKFRIKVTTPMNRFSGLRRLYNLRGPYCPLRAKGIHIRMDGSVIPCSCGFVGYNFGNILETSLKKIWQNPEYRQMRKNDQNPVCRSCELFNWEKSHKESPLKILSNEPALSK